MKNATKTTRAASPEHTSGTLGLRSAVELARMIRNEDISSVELTRYFIDRIERLDGRIDAIVVRDFDRALDAARRADAALAGGEALGPLHGLPMTFKEAYDVAGLPTSWGVPSHARNVASTSALVVQRFEAAGAIVLGKTNVPFMLGDFQSYNELYGTTNNPWDPTRTPGGSSGGSAAALAAGLTGLEMGSDIGGSIRNPAHFCGVYGHKPTWGIVPPQGHELPGILAAPDMAVLGPLARSAEDLAVALDVVAGPAPLEAPGWRLELPAPRRTSLRGLRVAVWPTDATAPVEDEIAERVQRVAELLASRGAVVSDRARPSFEPAEYRRLYVALVNSIVGAGLPDAAYEASKQRAAALDPGDASKPAMAARTLVLDHRAWLARNAERTRMRRQWRSFFEAWDVLLCPVMATTAFRHDHRPLEARTLTVNGVEQGWFDQVFWACLATVAYLPATVFPAGLSRDGLPIGLQAIGAEFADRTTIELARLLANELGGFVPPPGFAD
jgi:amidase